MYEGLCKFDIFDQMTTKGRRHKNKKKIWRNTILYAVKTFEQSLVYNFY